MAKKVQAKKKAATKPAAKKAVAQKKSSANKRANAANGTVTAKKPKSKASVATQKIGDIKGEATKGPKSKLPHTFNIDEITNLLNAVNDSGVNELKLEKDDFKITIRQGISGTATVVQAAAPQAMAPAPAAPAQAAPAAAAPAQSTTDAPPAADNSITVKSPMIGTFYRSSSPDKPPLVSVGDTIKEGDVLCIVEAMKLFNEIESEVSGTIVKVLVDDSSPVEYDQPLFLVEP